MNRITFFIMLCAASLTLNAADIIDVYGTNPKVSEEIVNKYGSQVADIEKQFNEEIVKLSNGGKGEHLEKVVFPNRIRLAAKIQKQYNFAFVQFNTISYPNDKNTHTTIEVIEQNDKSRLQYIPKNGNNPPPEVKHDIVDKMIKYHNTIFNLIFNKKLKYSDAKCPVYHCLPGFDQPQLKDTFSALAHSAPKEKALITRTIEKDPNSERRVAAIYLVGFFNNPQDIISFLNKFIMDSDDGVRNAAMRVIWETMNKSKINTIDIRPYVKLLDSPFDTDRNKSLLVLLDAAHSDSAKQIIIQQGNKSLIALLRLKQPNNHDIAYRLLKKISGKDFGPQNVVAWQKWFDEMNKPNEAKSVI